MNRTQIFLVIILYLMSSALNSMLLNRQTQRAIDKERNNSYIKPIMMNILIGIGWLLMLDFFSGGNPIWPALGLIIVFIGEAYPLFDLIKKKASVYFGFSSYFGGLFYLYPGMAFAAFGLSLQSLILTKDWIIAFFTFTGMVPILLKYMQVNPIFLASAITVELILIFRLRKEIWVKILNQK